MAALQWLGLGFSTLDGCAQSLNRAVHIFNVRLKTLVVALREQMPDSGLVFVNTKLLGMS